MKVWCLYVWTPGGQNGAPECDVELYAHEENARKAYDAYLADWRPYITDEANGEYGEINYFEVVPFADKVHARVPYLDPSECRNEAGEVVVPDEYDVDWLDIEVAEQVVLDA